MSKEIEPKKTVLHEEHAALGATMAPFAGFEMPIQYQGIVEEHLATRESAGIFDVSHMATLRVRGEGTWDFLQKMLTNDLAKIEEVGAAQYTLMLDTEGHIIDDLIVYHTGAEFMLIVNASNAQGDLEWLTQHCPEDVEIYDETERTAIIAVQGPESLKVIKELADDDEWEAPKRFHIAPLVMVGGATMLVARTGYTGEDGVELIMHKEDAAAVWRALMSFEEVNPVGLGARDTLRLEMGYHLYGNDMDRTRNPIEAGLGWVCPKAKEGYVGAKAVAAAREEGVAEKLVYLKVTGGIPREGYPVMDGDKQVGVVASGSHSPSLGIGVATAYVPAELAGLGTKLEIAIRKRKAQAEVVKPPFYVKED
ncbi:MAG: glycine cleavage system aminomethyltransferase GcvT [Coriobacteriia bacterium]|nr:glycine cleavage system aminomethyltransferase GcvT [Coriobacteriia bacterium]MCL2536984.1 glycine cleavage system aminomethyltransferase GcvT [Coriobacteriia bacterium]